MATTTRYAKSGDVHIAYRTLGSGPVDIVVAEQWFSNVEIEREVRPLARFNDRLSTFARVIRFDKRGVGLSDPVPATALPTLEEWMDDLRVVLDDVGSETAAIVTAMAGGFMACVFAATYPQRVRALVLDKQSGRSQEIAVTYKGAGILSEEELLKRGSTLRQLRIE